MNVTSPSTQHTPQAVSHALPVKRNTEMPSVDTGTSDLKPTPNNPVHLGNHVDTTA